MQALKWVDVGRAFLSPPIGGVMRKPIKGKYLNNTFSVNLETGEQIPLKSKMQLLPAKEGTCEECAVDHEKIHPHNAQSLFYKYKFYNEHGKWPTWLDAMAHCDENIQNYWKAALNKRGVKLD